MTNLNFDATKVQPHEGFQDVLSEGRDTTRNWSPFQTSIFSFVESGSGNAIVEAVAGSGKSTTIIEAMKLVRGSSIFLAFNKSIADELKAKGVNARTFHSLTFGAVLRATGANQPEPDKLKKILREAKDDGSMTERDHKLYSSFAMRLVGLAKQMGMGFLTRDTFEAWIDICAHHDIEPESESADLGTGIEWARKLLDWSNKDPRVDFDDMLYIAVRDRLTLPKFDFVFVDEAQDTNMIQREILRMIMRPNSRMIAVGDPCQPEGTLVEVVDRIHDYKVENRRLVPIEELKVGDTVTSYTMSTKAGIVHRKVLGISKNPYSRQLLRCEADGNVSRYTMEHQCIVRYQKGGYGLYVMARGRQFRVGITRLDHPQGCGPAIRLRQEDADAIWILETFGTRREALAAEIQTITQTGIPGTCWNVTNAHILEQQELDVAWEGVDNYERACALLSKYGRQISHPYFIRGQQGCSLRRPHIVFACNVLDGSKVMRRDKKWVEAKWSREDYSGDVYSLTVEGEEVYFADGILTHNCQAIYGFRGADARSLDLIAKEFNAVTLPLSITYRCPKAVVAYSQQWVSHIQAAETADEGEVNDLNVDWSPDDFSPNDLVVCRKTAPLISLAFKCIRFNVPAQVVGRDIGQGLKALISKMNARNIDQLVVKLQKYQERELHKARQDEDDRRAEQVQDKVGSILFLIDALREDRRNLAGLEAGIDYLFKDKQNAVKLSTIHKAKGLEADTVWWLNRSECPSRWARQPHQIQEELNLCYVAATRAKRVLNLIEDAASEA